MHLRFLDLTVFEEIESFGAGLLTKSFTQLSLGSLSRRPSNSLGPADGDFPTKDAVEPAAQTQLVTKSLNQEQPAELIQGVALERKLQYLQAFRHLRPSEKSTFPAVSQSSLNVNFVTPGLANGFACKITRSRNFSWPKVHFSG